MTTSSPYNFSVYIAFIIKITLILNSTSLVAANKTKQCDKTKGRVIT